MYSMYKLPLLIALFYVTFGYSNLNNDQDHLSLWKNHAKNKIMDKSYGTSNNGDAAKNVILFLGDGMGITVTTAARIYKSQKFPWLNYQQPFHFETYPFSGLVKTHSLNSHVTESSAAASAILCGAKIKNDHVSVLLRKSGDEYSTLECLASLAMKSGKSVGLVTTTRITHGTPAALYANTVNRSWEGDTDMTEEQKGKYKDIALQMVENWPGNNLSVIFGGGLSKFQRKTVKNKTVGRLDGRNLVEEWLNRDPKNRKFVQTLDEMNHLPVDKYKQILGIFETEDLPYVVDRNDSGTVPTLTDLTLKAINILSQNENGYFLLVEGGRIDHALHFNYAKRSFEELIAFDDAINATKDVVNLDETLMVVTADHSHNLKLMGYAEKNVSIFGLISNNDRTPIKDGLPSTMLVFGDGPAAEQTLSMRQEWAKDQHNVNFDHKNFQQPTMIFRGKASHGGEDVAVYARGPWSHMFTGLLENTDLFYFMCAAMKLDYCKDLDISQPKNHRDGHTKEQRKNFWSLLVISLLLGALFVSLLANILLVCRYKRA